VSIVWKPTQEQIERTNVWRFMQRLGFEDRAAFLRFSVDELERFWDETMREIGVQWFEPYQQVLDSSRGVEWCRWFTGGRLNIAYNCVDRWAQTDRIACIWEGENGETRTIGFRELRDRSNQVANALIESGLQAGDRVALCMPMIPEILAILYGCFRAGLTAVPIFAGFGAGAIASRIADSGARVVLTERYLTRRGKRLPLAEKMPNGVRTIIGSEFASAASSSFETASLDSEHRAIILYTSGTTGKPKGVVHTQAGCLAQMGKEIWLAFDHQPDDRFFWLSDIGWMMGPWTIIGNHLFGGTIFLYDGAPDYPTRSRLWDMIARHRITTFGVSPTAIRMLIDGSETLPAMTSLRILGSTGEPWDETSWHRYFEFAGRGRCPVINISGGTEIVGCFLFPLPIQELKPCTLGAPAPGMATEVVDDSGVPVRGSMGYLVCTKPAPSMTRGIWNDPQRYIETYWSRFPGMWYHGDWASVDQDGHWFLHGRADESMNVAGRKVGPAEVEQALMTHPSVAEAAVIGVPDALKGEAIVAFVTAKNGADLDVSAVSAAVVNELGPTLRPREIIAVEGLPKTQSGKIVRRLLRRQYLGEQLGDVSIVANPGVLKA
jgi:acetyl-CoA synthetase